MPHPEAKRWDERYKREQTQWLESKPRHLLISYAHLLPMEGRALDAAGGVGASSLYLAQRGLRVFALDVSEIALSLAKQRAQSRNLPLQAAVYDLSTPWLPPEYFKVILNFHFLERATISVFRQALTPEGLIFFETFIRIGDMHDKAVYYLEPGELISRFEDYEIIYYSEGTQRPSEAYGERGIAQLIARKPKLNQKG